MTLAQPVVVNGYDESALSSPGPFEGPEKLLEVWFAPSASTLPTLQPIAGSSRVRPLQQATHRGGGGDHTQVLSQTTQQLGDGGRPDAAMQWDGLRRVPREVWEEMLAIVQCQVLSVIQGEEIDAYLLRWVKHIT